MGSGERRNFLQSFAYRQLPIGKVGSLIEAFVRDQVGMRVLFQSKVHDWEVSAKVCKVHTVRIERTRRKEEKAINWRRGRAALFSLGGSRCVSVVSSYPQGRQVLEYTRRTKVHEFFRSATIEKKNLGIRNKAHKAPIATTMPL